MRIIGPGTRDYYDTAGWADQSRIFMRRPYDPEAAKANRWEVPVLFPESESDRNVFRSEPYAGVSFFLCLLAGECYPIARETRYAADGTLLSRAHHHDEGAVEALLRGLSRTRRRGRGFWALAAESADPLAFMRTPRDAMAGWALDHHAATAILRAAKRQHYKDPLREASGMINCDGLDGFELYRVIDPATAHMRLDGYVSGVLAQHPETVEIGDEARIAKAGFGPMSFKTRPGTRKRRGS